MIKIEHTVLPSPEQMKFIIEGMRNPMNSWDKDDSYYEDGWDREDFHIGENNLNLMRKLAKAGTDHRKYMRMMPVFVRVTAPLYFYKELDTYKVGTVSNSCSTMHKIQEKEFTINDFSCEQLVTYELLEKYPCGIDGGCVGDVSPKGVLYDIIDSLNKCRQLYLETKDKKYWWQMIQLLPSSYHQTRNLMLNYEVLANIYKSRRHHRLGEGYWDVFCDWIESLPNSELITGKFNKEN